jgi:hypothetical protein
MFEATVANGTDQLGLEEEVAKAGRVNADVAALLVDIVTGSELALLAVRGAGASGGLVAAKLLVGVVDEILFLRHVDGELRRMLRALLSSVESAEVVDLLMWRVSEINSHTWQDGKKVLKGGEDGG